MLRPFLLLMMLHTLLIAELHEHDAWEFGLSVGYADLSSEDATGSNIHLHLHKRIESDTFLHYFSYGMGAEAIVSDENHYSLMATLGFHPVDEFTVALSPSLVWAEHEGSWERLYATHIELAYSFDISEDLHMGPVIGYSKSAEAEHYTFGIHLGMPL